MQYLGIISKGPGGPRATNKETFSYFYYQSRKPRDKLKYNTVWSCKFFFKYIDIGAIIEFV